jgi:hypothetical protein
MVFKKLTTVALVSSISLTANAVFSATTLGPEIQEIQHQCTDGSRDFKLDFNYVSSLTDETVTLTNVYVGSCNTDDLTVVSSGTNHVVSSPSPWNCGVEDNRDNTVSSFSYEIEFSFDAVLSSGGIDLVIDSFVKTITCEFSDNYSASMSFDSGLTMETVDDGEAESDNSVSFVIESFNDNGLDRVLIENGTVYEAGNTAFLEVSVVGNFDDDLMEWSVTNCKINETISGLEYSLFNVKSVGIANVCQNDQISLNFTEVGDEKRIEYQVFMFSGLDTEAQNYEISCDIAVCMKSVEGSQCDVVSENCGFEDHEDPLDPLEDLTCEVGENVTDRHEVYAEFEASVCGGFLAAGYGCFIKNVVCGADGTFTFDFDLDFSTASVRSGVNCPRYVIGFEKSLNKQFPKHAFNVNCA